jgi:prophage regulatory protein
MMNRILRKPDLRELTGLSPRTIDAMEKRGEFPRRIKLSARCVGWRADQVNEWLDQRSAAEN